MRPLASQTFLLAQNRVPSLIFGIAVVGGTVLRLWHLTAESLWLDEVFSVWVARQPWSAFWHYVRLESHPPLYYLILRLWLAVFAPTGAATEADLAARFLSAILSACIVPVAGVTAWRLRGPSCGAFTSLVFAVLPPLVRYGQEARMYAASALLAAIALASALLYAHTLRPRYVAVYTAALIVAFYTHYYIALLWPGFAIGLAVCRAGRPTYSAGTEGKGTNPPLTPLKAHLIIGTAFLPWLPMLLQQVKTNSHTHWLLNQPKPDAGALVDYVRWCVGLEDGMTAASAPLATASYVIVFLCLLALVCGSGVVPPKTGTRQVNTIDILLPGTIVPLALALLVSQFKNIWQFKYLIGVVPCVGAWLVLVLECLRRKPTAFVLVGTCLLGTALGATLANVGTMRPWNQEEWREASAVVRTQLRPGDVCLVPEPVTLPPTWVCLEHYGIPRLYLLGVREDISRPEDKTVMNKVRVAPRRLFLVTRFGNDGMVRTSVLAQTAWRETRRWSFRAVDVTLYERAPASERKQVP